MQTQTRLVGSGFTTLLWRGLAIAWLEGFTDSGQAPLVGPEAIIPLGFRHPVEIATCRAVDMGSVTMSIREIWQGPVWQQLAGLAATHDIIDVYEAMANDPAEVTMQMIIKPPGASAWRGKTYHNCVVTGIPDGETVEIRSMTMPRNVIVSYTHTTPVVQGIAG